MRAQILQHFKQLLPGKLFILTVLFLYGFLGLPFRFLLLRNFLPPAPDILFPDSFRRARLRLSIRNSVFRQLPLQLSFGFPET